MAKDAYYFPHDSNARNDPKILSMRTIYGAEGYGWFFMIIEILRDQEDYRLPVNQYTFNALAMQLNCQPEAIKKFVEACSADFKDAYGPLLFIDKDYIWSESLLRRMGRMDNIREQARLSALKRWHPSVGNAIALLPQSVGNARRVKNSKEENSKEEEKKTEEFPHINSSSLNKNEVTETWEKTLQLLNNKVSHANFKTWLVETKALGRNDHYFFVECPRRDVVEHLNNNLKSIIEKCFLEVGGAGLQLVFTVKETDE